MSVNLLCTGMETCVLTCPLRHIRQGMPAKFVQEGSACMSVNLLCTGMETCVLTCPLRHIRQGMPAKFVQSIMVIQSALQFLFLSCLSFYRIYMYMHKA